MGKREWRISEVGGWGGGGWNEMANEYELMAKKFINKNVFLLKDGIEFMIKKFDIMGVHWKIQFLAGGSRKNNI